MVTEYIKRDQKWGYDENGNFLYKLPLTAESPVAATEEVVEEVVEEDSSFVGSLFGK